MCARLQSAKQTKSAKIAEMGRNAFVKEVSKDRRAWVNQNISILLVNTTFYCQTNQSKGGSYSGP